MSNNLKCFPVEFQVGWYSNPPTDCIPNTEIKDQYHTGNSDLDFDVDSVGIPPLDEGRPQPVVHIRIANVTNHIRPPVDTLVII
jgi:hypothetical protein